MGLVDFTLYQLTSRYICDYVPDCTCTCTMYMYMHTYKSAMYNHVPLKIKRSSLEIVLLFYKLLLRCLACRIKTKLKNVKVFYEITFSWLSDRRAISKIDILNERLKKHVFCTGVFCTDRSSGKNRFAAHSFQEVSLSLKFLIQQVLSAKKYCITNVDA